MGLKPRKRQEQLASKLLRIRHAFGLSQNGIIKALKLGPEQKRTHISAYELGKNEPPLYVILKYARAVGVGCEVLIDDKLDLPDGLPASPLSVDD